MYTLERLFKSAQTEATEINGRWVPARPLAWGGLYGLWLNLKDAWEVIRGRADAFTWPEGQ